MAAAAIVTLIKRCHGEIVIFLGCASLHDENIIMAGITVETGSHRVDLVLKFRITSYNVCYTKLLR